MCLMLILNSTLFFQVSQISPEKPSRGFFINLAKFNNYIRLPIWVDLDFHKNKSIRIILENNVLCLAIETFSIKISYISS